MARSFAIAFSLAIACVACPALARDSLGVFDTWAAFRDPSVPRCYAIAMPAPAKHANETQPFVTIGTWPSKDVRGQVHFRLARKVQPGHSITLKLGGRYFALTGSGVDAWARDPRSDAAILAAMRSQPVMTVFATDSAGKRYWDSYTLKGAASAMDAASVGCSNRS
ncbi:MAG: hypothetical protein ABGW87_02200 [Sphingomonadaceae bacterium]